MVRKVEQTAELNKPLGDGSTLRDTLEFQQKMYGIKDARLKEEPLPYLCIPTWNTFWALHSTRTSTQLGYGPITFSEMKAYSDLMRVTFEPYEVEMLNRMDSAFLAKLNTSGAPTKESK